MCRPQPDRWTCLRPPANGRLPGNHKKQTDLATKRGAAAHSKSPFRCERNKRPFPDRMQSGNLLQPPIATPNLNVARFRVARLQASTLRRGIERGRRRNGGSGVYFARTGPVDLGPRVWFQRHVGFIATRDLSCPVGKRRRGHPESRQAVSSSSENNLQVKVIFHCHFMVVQSNSFTNSHIPETYCSTTFYRR